MTENLAVEVDVKNPDRGAGVVRLIYFVRIVGYLRLRANSHIHSPLKVTLAYFLPPRINQDKLCIGYFVQKTIS